VTLNTWGDLQWNGPQPLHSFSADTPVS